MHNNYRHSATNKNYTSVNAGRRCVLYSQNNYRGEAIELAFFKFREQNSSKYFKNYFAKINTKCIILQCA